MQQDSNSGDNKNRFSDFWYSSVDCIEELLIKLFISIPLAALDHGPKILKIVFHLPKEESTFFFLICIGINFLITINEIIRRALAGLPLFNLFRGTVPLIVNVILTLVFIFFIILVHYADNAVRSNILEYMHTSINLEDACQQGQEPKELVVVGRPDPVPEELQVEAEPVFTVNGKEQLVYNIPSQHPLEVDMDINFTVNEEVATDNLSKDNSFDIIEVSKAVDEGIETPLEAVPFIPMVENENILDLHKDDDSYITDEEKCSSMCSNGLIEGFEEDPHNINRQILHSIPPYNSATNEAEISGLLKDETRQFVGVLELGEDELLDLGQYLDNDYDISQEENYTEL